MKFSALTILICVLYFSSYYFTFFFFQLTCGIILLDFMQQKKGKNDFMLGVKEVIEKTNIHVYARINLLHTF